MPSTPPACPKEHALALTRLVTNAPSVIGMSILTAEVLTLQGQADQDMLRDTAGQVNLELLWLGRLLRKRDRKVLFWGHL